MLLESEIMLQEGIYGTGVTPNVHHLRWSYFYRSVACIINVLRS
jgi:hypothetical protein